ncbi:prephenate dehydrogenase [Fredinandcohnia quinoae]|uniref:Prephenate dehydrogenase n=1 Tax=Fredinandcohnia quinoae TaxID=2918902 RepID=A0AAW5E1W6_9BACI|nr:prephenate dehydrogenase [Fredinandcohnia sp. SECRCQ15]MCH1624739.1 prephenate dehydrogenase [Fredinandcohnia sp. SECRCQ15]
MKQVLIIGLGLIGGSIGLAIKKEHPNTIIYGYDLHTESMMLAKTLCVIDEEVTNIDKVIHICDYVIVAVPVKQAEEIIHQISAYELKENVIITDVGSTKQQIVTLAERLFTKRGVTFIGGHPMAGSHKSGVVAAKSHLFENAFYIFTPSNVNSSMQELDNLKELLKGTKANFVTMSANDHDYIAGVISHFPHIIAASLVHQADKYEKQNELIKPLAAGGFRDITRIASSNPSMWRDILLHNRETLLDLFQNWFEEMERIRSFVAVGNGDKIYDYFLNAKNFRDGLPERTKGAIPSFYDLFVDVPDYPGVISEITGLLANEKISITNIRIIETREEIYGVLRISFQNENDREMAKNCIESNTSYETFYG